MAAPPEDARNAYNEFLEKVKRTIFLDNLSPQVTEPVVKKALGQFGNVVKIEFIPNYTIPYPIPQAALVEMENEKQAKGIVAELTSYPFMMSGMPRPVRAKPAKIEMFADRPALPDRKIEVRWVEPSDPDFNVVNELKLLYKRQNADHLAMVKHLLDEEEKIQKKQEETLQGNYKKYEQIEKLMGEGISSRLARQYGLRLDDDGYL
ncbi:ASI1-immunoprecipitated protein 1 [Curcuma longa]|uniref:ASI1-immunoprecipitated protein 1 n=1 Tax=Curcuma longa TaxID=136217 RepID=UPI003D9F1FF9